MPDPGQRSSTSSRLRRLHCDLESRLRLLLAALGAAGLGGGFFLTALLWTAHIGFDRMAGYGLKYASSFLDTHLGRVGQQAGV